MNNSRIKRWFFLLVIFTFILIGYSLRGNHEEVIVSKPVFIDRVVDGDTFESNGSKFRLLGINTPEKNEHYYQEAKSFLKSFEGNYSVFDFVGVDKYGRNLGYLHFGNLLVNNEIIVRGLASSYYYGSDGYKSLILDSESLAKSKGLGIWERSSNSCYGCLFINEVHNGAGENDCEPGVEFVKLKNGCSFDCDISNWLIKDSSSAHIYVFGKVIMGPQSILTLYSGKGKDAPERGKFFFNNKESCSSIWNDDGDNVFLRDDEGLLVDFKRY